MSEPWFTLTQITAYFLVLFGIFVAGCKTGPYPMTLKEGLIELFCKPEGA